MAATGSPQQGTEQRPLQSPQEAASPADTFILDAWPPNKAKFISAVLSDPGLWDFVMATTGDEYSDFSGSVQRGSAEMGSRVPWADEEGRHELQKTAPTCDASIDRAAGAQETHRLMEQNKFNDSLASVWKCAWCFRSEGERETL